MCLGCVCVCLFECGWTCMLCMWRPEAAIQESSSLSTLFIKIGILNGTQNSCFHLMSTGVISRLSHYLTIKWALVIEILKILVFVFVAYPASTLICELLIQPETDVCSQPGLGLVQGCFMCSFYIKVIWVPGKTQNRRFVGFCLGELGIF